MAQSPKLFEALTDSGLRAEAARGVETQVHSMVDQGIERHRQHDHQQLMTKADGLALEHTLRTEINGLGARLRQEMSEMRTELREEMSEMKSDLRQEISELKTEIHRDMAHLEVRLMRHIHEHGLKMLGFQVATTGLLLTAFKYLH